MAPITIFSKHNSEEKVRIKIQKLNCFTAHWHHQGLVSLTVVRTDLKFSGRKKYQKIFLSYLFSVLNTIWNDQGVFKYGVTIVSALFS